MASSSSSSGPADRARELLRSLPRVDFASFKALDPPPTDAEWVEIAGLYAAGHEIAARRPFDIFTPLAAPVAEERVVGLEDTAVEEGVWRCRDPKCKSRRVRTFQKQPRSADEGTTTFVVCTVCQKQYKIT
jgi:hypothetical protein